MADPILISSLVSIPADAVEVRAVRSSGPGGQNVNKVSSKIELRVDLGRIVGLPSDAYERLLVLCRGRLDADGKLLLTSQKTRDQPKNLADARQKVRALVEQALIRPIRRRPTKPSRGAIERRLAEKKHNAQNKQARRPDD